MMLSPVSKVMESQREEVRRRKGSDLLSNHLIIDPIKDGSDGVKHAKHFPGVDLSFGGISRG